MEHFRQLPTTSDGNIRQKVEPLAPALDNDLTKSHTELLRKSWRLECLR